MKLSTLLRDPNFHFESIEPDGETSARYLPFSSCARKALGVPMEDQSQVIVEMFPLAMGCPFFGLGGGRAQELAVAEFPDGCSFPAKYGIYFLCDAIDLMAYKLKMTPSAIADVVERIEDRFTQNWIDLHGHQIKPTSTGRFPR